MDTETLWHIEKCCSSNAILSVQVFLLNEFATRRWMENSHPKMTISAGNWLNKTYRHGSGGVMLVFPEYMPQRTVHSESGPHLTRLLAWMAPTRRDKVGDREVRNLWDFVTMSTVDMDRSVWPSPLFTYRLWRMYIHKIEFCTQSRSEPVIEYTQRRDNWLSLVDLFAVE